MSTSHNQLKEYRNKRDFRRTAEPSGDGRDKPGDKPVFVVQKHAASRLHYDVRLEVDGVLKSWAVPKGPSMDPKDKRLAVMTEDHPMDYADFEGTIPDDQYGGGAVIVWDTGTYDNMKELEAGDAGSALSMQEALDAGEVTVRLNGKKLTGGFALIHSKMGGNPKNWLLMKMKDDQAAAGSDVVNKNPTSVLSGRDINDLL